MRSFVITRPGLSAGPPGSHLTAVDLRMDDDRLDAFVEAGYAIEIFSDGDRPRGRVIVDAPDDVELGDLDNVVALLATEDPDALAEATDRHPSAATGKRKRRT